MMQPKLPLYEWVIVLLFCSILLLLSFFSVFGSSSRQIVPETLSKSSIFLDLQVSIEGAVAQPGTYELPLKSSVEDLLKIAQPLPIADLSRLNKHRKLIDGQVVRIPEKKWITIYLEGEVENPGAFQLLSGTRCYELIDQLDFKPEADKNHLKRMRRYLKEGETVKIIKKKERKALVRKS